MAKEKAFYFIRLVNAKGVVYYLSRLSFEEYERLHERLDRHTAAGDLGEYEMLPITPQTAQAFQAVSDSLDDLLGNFDATNPDEKKVEERFDPETEKMVRYLLTGAFEGGSNYWYRIESRKLPPGTQKEDFKQGGRMQPEGDYFHPLALIPTFPGGQLVIREIGDGEGEAFVLDLPALKRGLMLMREKFPKNYQRVLDENDDAADADVFLQLALLGDVVFG